MGLTGLPLTTGSNALKYATLRQIHDMIRERSGIAHGSYNPGTLWPFSSNAWASGTIDYIEDLTDGTYKFRLLDADGNAASWGIGATFPWDALAYAPGDYQLVIYPPPSKQFP